MDKRDVIEIICRVLMVLFTVVNTGLYFSTKKVVLGIFGIGLSIVWFWLLVDAIKKLRGE